MLIVRRTKFGKSRSIVLHPNTSHALHQYLNQRQSTGAESDKDACFFIVLRADVLGKPLGGYQVRQVYWAIQVMSGPHIAITCCSRLSTTRGLVCLR
ncbi:hypothetical protein [Rahnella ecdela]|uniref:hypothetical protein n=1 Tax=Rahnella ecdela TaxID=2816250 RepID=UPI003B75BACB